MEQKLTKLSRTLILLNNSQFKQNQLEDNLREFASLQEQLENSETVVTKEKLNEL